MSKKHESSVITYSSGDSLAARSALFEKLRDYPATAEETERSLGLFLRASLLARVLAIEEIYRKIINIPGIIIDLGTWRGQTSVLCENFRAIHEPLHFNRRIVCFDTFEGYKGFSDKDTVTALHRDGTYSTGTSYATYLEELLLLHEKNNAMGHNHGKHRVISGDCTRTLPDFLNANPHEFVALAFFDLNAFEPTRQAFEKVWERMVPGGIAAFWQLTRDKVPAEGAVYTAEILNKLPHRLERSARYPGLCYLTK